MLLDAHWTRWQPTNPASDHQKALPVGRHRLGRAPPLALGVEAAGEVVGVGPEVEWPATGAGVMTHPLPLAYQGCWAERLVAPARLVAEKPNQALASPLSQGQKARVRVTLNRHGFPGHGDLVSHACARGLPNRSAGTTVAWRPGRRHGARHADKSWPKLRPTKTNTRRRQRGMKPKQATTVPSGAGATPKDRASRTLSVAYRGTRLARNVHGGPSPPHRRGLAPPRPWRRRLLAGADVDGVQDRPAMRLVNMLCRFACAVRAVEFRAP
jgi:hypothetical protein